MSICAYARCLSARCFALALFIACSSLMLVHESHAANCGDSNVKCAVSGTDYTQSNAQALSAVSNTIGFSVNAWGICRYIDVHNVPGGAGVLVPFKTDAEWKGKAGKGFIETSDGPRNSYVHLDLCRMQAALPNVDFGDATKGVGISVFQTGVASDVVKRTNVSPARVQPVLGAAQKRIDSSSSAAFDASLTEPRSQSYSLNRTDCLGNVTYPDGSTHNPCYTWSWVESITATFKNNPGVDFAHAVAAAQNPNFNAATNWDYTLTRTCPRASNGVSNDGRGDITSSCPPAVQAPTLRNCPPEAHNTHKIYIVQAHQSVDLGCDSGSYGTNIKTWDVQEDDLCFDGQYYPGAQTIVNVRVDNQCKPIVNGVCGSANGHTYNTFWDAAGFPNACSSGHMNYNYNNGVDTYGWDCIGDHGTSQYGCRAYYRAPTNGQCGSLNGTTQNYWYDQVGYPNVCANGSFANSTFTGNGYKWNCVGSNGGSTASCSYTHADKVEGACGSLDGTTQTYWYDQVGYPNVCSSGSFANSTFTGNGYRWQCQGSNGGGTASCSYTHQDAAAPLNGQCGSANGVATHDLDVNGWPNTCNAGSRINAHWNGNGYDWQCQGANGGSTATCNAGYAPQCTTGSEDQTVACGSGMTGNKVQRRTTDSCHGAGAWQDYDTSQCVTTTYHWDTGDWNTGSCN